MVLLQKSKPASSIGSPIGKMQFFVPSADGGRNINVASGFDRWLGYSGRVAEP